MLAVLLHFFFLSAFAWMLVEGLHLYSLVIKVFGSEGSKRRYYYGIGWGRCGRVGTGWGPRGGFLPTLHLEEARRGEPWRPNTSPRASSIPD